MKPTLITRRARHVLLVLAVGALVPALALWYVNRPDETADGSAAEDTPRAEAPAEGPPVWVRHDPPLETTWPDQPRFTSDGAPRPVAAGDLVLLTSSRHDCVTAVAAATGEARWRFVADGPVRFAPAVWKGHGYVASDDGFLYCLGLADGSVKWKVRGGPGPRLVLGNERVISTWPVRGGPAVAPEGDGKATVYFAAGIWPFMGIFLHAVDAETGAVRWTNSGDGATFQLQPHGGAYAFAGVAPQGSLVVAGDRLIVPGGRSIPACYDRHTGKLVHHRLSSDVSRMGGGPDVLVGPGMYFNGPGAFTLDKGDYLGAAGETVAVSGPLLVRAVTSTCRIHDLRKRIPPALDDKGKPKVKANEEWLGAPLVSVKAPVRPTALLADGGRVWGAGQGVVFALDLPKGGAPARVSWQAKVEGTAVHLASAGGRVYVSTREGRVYAFTEGQPDQPPTVHKAEVAPLPAGSEEQVNLAKKVLATTGARAGYAVVWGVGTGGLVAELLRQSELSLVIVEPDADKVAAFREKLRRADLDGKRVSVLRGTAKTAGLPPYLANVMVSERPGDGGVDNDAAGLDALFRSLRPYGGIACLALPEAERGPVREWIKARPGEGQARVREDGGLVLISREGALPGAGNWTHQHADAANTRVSPDERVKAPLGVLWFGGPGNHSVLPRHGHGPVPQVIDGRLVIEGANGLRAIDVYTGRLLWEAKLPGLGKAYDNTTHQPGANAIGSNYACAPDGIYVAYRDRCLRLDLDTGKELGTFTLPPLEGEKEAPEWTFVSVAGDHLIGGASPRGAMERSQTYEYKKKPREALRGSEVSRRLTVFDRRTGRPLWGVEAREGFRHNGICAGNGKLFAIDRQPFSLKALVEWEAKDAKEKKGKRPASGAARLVAFELATGRPLWEVTDGAFGTWLSYSEKHDVLVEAGLMARDTLFGEPPGMRAYRGTKGDLLWERKDYYGPAMIHGDRILKGGDPAATSGTACDLRTGEPVRETDPLTGVPVEWQWKRTYGCNTPAASRNLVLFRSGAAGYYDLCDSGGTGNLGGVRSSCTFNLIPAGGVLTLPDFTRTCTCAYQNQTSVGFVHDPDVEMWTFTLDREVTGPVRRIGVNLGAPGGRKSATGTLWLEHPAAVNVGAKRTPRVKVTAAPAKAETFRLHSSQVAGEGPAWVVSAGARGLTRLSVALGGSDATPRAYTVKLYFLEPDDLPAGGRRFDVVLQGRAVLKGLDVAKEAGGARRGLVKQFTGIKAGGELVIRLAPEAGGARQESVLSGVEVIAEGGDR